MLLKCSKQVKATLLELPFVVAAPYLVGWLLLAAALWWVGRARRWQEEGLTTRNSQENICSSCSRTSNICYCMFRGLHKPLERIKC